MKECFVMRDLMTTDIIRELRKLVEEHGDHKVYVSTDFEYAPARVVNTYDDGTFRIGYN